MAATTQIAKFLESIVDEVEERVRDDFPVMSQEEIDIIVEDNLKLIAARLVSLFINEKV